MLCFNLCVHIRIYEKHRIFNSLVFLNIFIFDVIILIIYRIISKIIPKYPKYKNCHKLFVLQWNYYPLRILYYTNNIKYFVILLVMS